MAARRAIGLVGSETGNEKPDGAFRFYGAPMARNGPAERSYTRRCTMSFFSSAIASAGFKPFGHAFTQFMMVWQR